jgi:hypothetical protein
MAIEDAPSSAELRRENARLRGELAAMRDELARARAHEAEALDQQAAAGRVLQVLGGSRSDTQPVFDAIVASAVRLCDGVIGSLFSFEANSSPSPRRSTPSTSTAAPGGGRISRCRRIAARYSARRS